MRPIHRLDGPTAGTLTALFIAAVSVGACTILDSRPPLIVSGVVLEPVGAPLPNEPIELWMSDGTNAATTTDANGRFEFRGLPRAPGEVAFLLTLPARSDVAATGCAYGRSSDGTRWLGDPPSYVWRVGEVCRSADGAGEPPTVPPAVPPTPPRA